MVLAIMSNCVSGPAKRPLDTVATRVVSGSSPFHVCGVGVGSRMRATTHSHFLVRSLP